jgi:site-specific DNA-methyltransferase (adenine-specific)
LNEPDNSVDLIIFSPPYNAGIKYDTWNDSLELPIYLDFLKTVIKECLRVLKVGGRICINVANVMRKPYIPLNLYVMQIFQELKVLLRGEIVWLKTMQGTPCNGSTAWGSWLSPSNPVLRDSHESILIATKDEDYDHEITPESIIVGSKDTYELQDKGEADLTPKEFKAWTCGEWLMQPESRARVNHPAPFPEELPSRLIKLFSYKNAIVLDPFVGSGNTCVAAKKLKRQYIGYDISKKYQMNAQKRCEQNYLA